jgi:beta-lactamase superfamily II metal-dependent hydrolase
MITIEMFPAGNGDAILISDGKINILIDGGYTSTYRDHLKSRLIQLNQTGQKIDKYIITHIDADHITGAITFLKDNGPSDIPTIINVDEVWFNSYRHLHFSDKKDDLLQNPPSIPIYGGIASSEVDDPEVMVSFGQGSTFGSQLLKHGYSWNKDFDFGAVCCEHPKQISINSEASFTLLGPTPKALEGLGNKWYKDLRKRYQGKITQDNYFDDAFELLLEEIRQEEEKTKSTLDFEQNVSLTGDWVKDYQRDWDNEDNSVTNASSITFLLEINGKKLLFLGDAIPSQSTSMIKQLIPPGVEKLKVDLVKVAHHGAFYNNSPELIQLIKADYFLFSSNGSRHHHPHLPTLSMIVGNIDYNMDKILVFNYHQQNLKDKLEENALKQKYRYSTRWPKEGENGYIKVEL